MRKSNNTLYLMLFIVIGLLMCTQTLDLLFNLNTTYSETGHFYYYIGWFYLFNIREQSNLIWTMFTAAGNFVGYCLPLLGILFVVKEKKQPALIIAIIILCLHVFSLLGINNLHELYPGSKPSIDFYVISIATIVIIVLLLLDLSNSKKMKNFTPKIPSGTNATINLKVDNIEEIKKLKQLVDAGVLSQEEFDLKKRKLL